MAVAVLVVSVAVVEDIASMVMFVLALVVSCVPENESTHDIVARMTPTNKEAFLRSKMGKTFSSTVHRRSLSRPD